MSAMREEDPIKASSNDWLKWFGVSKGHFDVRNKISDWVLYNWINTAQVKGHFSQVHRLLNNLTPPLKNS